MIIRPTLSFFAPTVPLSSLVCSATSQFGSDGRNDAYTEGHPGAGLSDLTRPAPGKTTLTSRLAPRSKPQEPSDAPMGALTTRENPTALQPHDDPFGLHLIGADAATAPATTAAPKDLIAAADFDFGEVVVGGRYRQALYFYNLHLNAPAYVTVTVGERNRGFVLIPPRSNNLLRRPAGEEQLPPAFVEENFFHLFWNPIEPGTLNVPATITLSWNEAVKEPAQTKTIRIKGVAYAAGEEKPSTIAARKAQEEEAARTRDAQAERSARLDRRVKRDNERDAVYPAGAVRELSAAYEKAQDALTLLTEKQAVGARVAGEEAGRYRKAQQFQTPGEASSLAEYVLQATNKGLGRYARKAVESALGGGVMVAIASALVQEIVTSAGNAAIKRIFDPKSQPDRDNSDIYFFSSLESMLRDIEFDRQTALQHSFDQLQTMTPKDRETAVQAMEAIAEALRETAAEAVKEQADQARYAWMRELALRELGTRAPKPDADGKRPAVAENALWHAKEKTAPGIAGVLDLTVLTDRHHKSGLTIAGARMNGVIDEMASVLAEKPLSELRHSGIVMRVTLKDPSLADTLGYVVVDRDQVVFLDKTGSPFDPASPYAAGWLSYFSPQDRGTPLKERQVQGARELINQLGSQTLATLGIQVVTDHDKGAR